MSDKSEARNQIRALMFGYAETLDNGDLDGVAAFFEHCTISVEGLDNSAHGAAEVRRFFDTVIFYKGDAQASQDDPQSTPATKHLTTNVVIDVADDLLSATARSCFTVLQSRPDFPLQPVISGRYHDRFECVEGRWRFAKRHEFIDLLGDLSRHLKMSLSAS